jgi:pyruvate dehydrogenase E1 component beta subunit
VRAVRPGVDVTLVTYGALVQRGCRPARSWPKGSRCRVLDLRTMQPLDFDSVARSVKTGRVLVAQDALFCGFRAEVAARPSGCFMDLDAPVRRVSARHAVAYAQLEDVILPQKDTLVRALRELAAFWPSFPSRAAFPAA